MMRFVPIHLRSQRQLCRKINVSTVNDACVRRAMNNLDDQNKTLEPKKKFEVISEEARRNTVRVVNINTLMLYKICSRENILRKISEKIDGALECVSLLRQQNHQLISTLITKSFDSTFTSLMRKSLESWFTSFVSVKSVKRITCAKSINWSTVKQPGSKRQW